MEIIQVTDNTVESVIREHPVVLVDFWAPWCGPCRMIAPILEQLAQEVGDKALIAKCNVDVNPYAAIKYHIQGIPTLKLFVNGREAATFVGVQPLHKLKETILRYAA